MTRVVQCPNANHHDPINRRYAVIPTEESDSYRCNACGCTFEWWDTFHWRIAADGIVRDGPACDGGESIGSGTSLEDLSDNDRRRVDAMFPKVPWRHRSFRPIEVYASVLLLAVVVCALIGALQFFLLG